MRTQLLVAFTGSFWSSAEGKPTRTHVNSQAAAVSPQVAHVSLVANLTDPAITRDSCVSARFGDRVLWTCRDTETYDFANDKSELPLITNSASWTDFTKAGVPAITSKGPRGAGSDGSNPILRMYGGNLTASPSAFFPVPKNACPPSGFCTDQTRYAFWPNSSPLVTSTGGGRNGQITAYSWIPKAHLRKLKPLNGRPPTSLYKISYNPGSASKNDLPSVKMVDENFWPKTEIAFGEYGGLVVNDTAYLYGHMAKKQAGSALAKVSVDHIEDVSRYEYFVNGAWTKKQPGLTTKEALVPNAGTGGRQGTFYYSTYFDSYVWIGQSLVGGSAEFFISTAPAPEGPWIAPYKIYTGPSGDSTFVGAYSCVANPALLKSASQRGIYLTWTQAFEPSTYGAYVTPLVYITWK